MKRHLFAGPVRSSLMSNNNGRKDKISNGAGLMLVFASLLLWATAGTAGSIMAVDYKNLVSRADLDYNEPAGRSEEGMPVGNGRMGSLVWTTPTELKFQINHVNVYGINCETNSFPIRHTDYASTCGYLDITFVDYGDDVFVAGSFRQHLVVYDGLFVLAQGWDASFTLLASGAFMVSSSMEKGRIEFVEIQSPRVFLSEDRSGGGECRLHNPWPDTVLTLYRNGRKADDLSADSSGLLRFPTAQGETITIVPRGSTFSRKKVS